ncbi:hypothetical protein C7999DRAFT_16027 [Corynascus novoguineensis]|uniref:DUF7587 domain-containing protein n=1 Tax=Corynascus novoguineensis TaxID=1126955 RepID=A0AAN7CQ17_9PEZI|nr:hypothetical protein C7999DRAFT_16027 [Corynascus novoguineensis]
MASQALTEGLQALSLYDADFNPDPNPVCLPFCPTGDKEWVQEKFEVPRYLFRVFTPKSCGYTDILWAKSMDARGAKSTSSLDIFARDDKRVAEMLYLHLNWWKGPEDNLVSWTSSLLFAIVYIFYLHASHRDGSDFNDISLCVLDTTDLPKGVLLRDMDLIRAYSSSHKRLQQFERFRLQKKHEKYSGSFYFGEYFSQGALKIEGKCQIVSAQEMIGRGLYDLQPEFKTFAEWEKQEKPPWANPVIMIREIYYQAELNWQRISMNEREAAMNIAALFGPRWRLPMAANLIAMLPHRVEESDILQAFRAVSFSKVERFGDIMRSIYREFCLLKIKGAWE